MSKLSIRISLFTILLTLLCVFLPTDKIYAANNTVKSQVKVTYDYKQSYQVLREVNKSRQKAGLSKLKMSKSLLSSAMKRACETTYLYDHKRPDGTSCFTINPLAYGENIAVGQQSASQVFTDWMNSPSHKANIMSRDYKSIGIGCIKYNDTFYWVQLFGIDSAKSYSCPANKAVTATINIKKKKNAFKPVDTPDKTYAEGQKIKLKLMTPNSKWPYNPYIPSASSFTWKSSNTKVLKITSGGTITFLKKGSATVTAYYKGTKTIAFSRKFTVRKDFTKAKVTMAKSFTYTGKTIKPNVKVAFGSTVLKKDKDYTLNIKYGKNVGKYSVKVTGIGTYYGVIDKSYSITPKSGKHALIHCQMTDLSNSDTIMRDLEGGIIIEVDGRILTVNEDYYIESFSYTNATKTLLKVTIAFCGNYKGNVAYFPDNV